MRRLVLIAEVSGNTLPLAAGPSFTTKVNVFG